MLKKGFVNHHFISNVEIYIDSHFSTYRTLSAIDLTICSSQLLPISSWSVIDDLHNSDHFPILTSITVNATSVKHPPKQPQYNCKRANWTKYQDSISEVYSKLPPSLNNNKEAALITKIIRYAANKSIPLTKRNIKINRNVPWWSSSLGHLRNLKQQAWREFRRNMTTENLVNFNK